MARRSKRDEPRTANLTLEEIRSAIPQLKRRIQELEQFDIEVVGDALVDEARRLQRKIDDTLVQIFGPDTVEYRRYRIPTLSEMKVVLASSPPPLHEKQNQYRKGIQHALSTLRAALEILEERVEPLNGDATDRVVHAYKGLELHPQIAEQASSRFLSGHYADAVEAAVKALNNLVRLKSGESLDGTQLMMTVFSPKKPLLRFSALKEQSDKDEQQGFMYLFAGAVMGLRNPRAHGFINDDPERALEFIAFISLLAKLLDDTREPS